MDKHQAGHGLATKETADTKPLATQMMHTKLPVATQILMQMAEKGVNL